MTGKKKLCLFLIPLFVTSITLMNMLSIHANPGPPTARFTWTRELAPYNPQPSALPTYPVVNETVNFNASASNGGNITSYAWDFDGDGIIDKTVNETATTWNYSAPGIYNVTLNVTDTEGLWDTVSHVVEVVKEPYLSIVPSETIVSEPGLNFTIDINITDATNMWSFDFKLNYDPSIIEALRVYPGPIPDTIGTYDWVPHNASDVFDPAGPPTIDNTIGRVWAGFLLALGQSFTGNGTLLRISFTAKSVGNVTLHFYETNIFDRWSDPYLHDTLDGEVRVLPEFPTFVIMPLILIAGLTATFLGKRLRLRKRKDALITCA